LIIKHVRSPAVTTVQGEVGDQFYVVEHGKLGVFKSPDGAASTQQQQDSLEPLLLYGPGSYFGELALLRNEPRAATVSAPWVQ
jgi:CRP-like cAMP-binding protein